MSSSVATYCPNVTTCRNLSLMNQSATDAAVSVIDYVIGENVATLQRRAGLTNGELGAHFGVTASAMSLKLHGKRAWSALDVQRAATIFNVRMGQLVGEEPMPSPTAPATVTNLNEERLKRGPRPVIDVKQLHSSAVTNMFEWRDERDERAADAS